MKAVQLIEISTEELQTIVADAVREGVRAGLEQAKAQATVETPISRAEFKKAAGYSCDRAFRNFCSANKIYPIDRKSRKQFFYPSQLARTQPIH